MATAAEPAYELRAYFRPLRRRWRLLAAAIALGGACGGVGVALTAHSYTSTTSVLVTPTGASTAANAVGGRTQDLINLDTEAQLVTSRAVEERVRRALATHASDEQLGARVSIYVPPNSTILRISFRAGSAERAQAGARAFARAYLEDRAESARTLLSRKAAATDRQMALVAGRLDAAAATGQENGARTAVYKNEVWALATALAAPATTVVTAGRIVSDATPATSQFRRTAFVLVLSGIMGGVLFGVFGVFFRDGTDPRVRDSEELESLDLPVAAALSGTAADDLPGYRRLANSLGASSEASGGVVTVAAISADQRDTRDVGVALGIATVLQAAGRTVTVVDGDAAARLVREYEADGAERVRSELLGPAEFAVIDAGRCFADPEVQRLARISDGVTLVSEQGTTRVADARDAVQVAQLVGVKFLATVLDTARPPRTKASRVEAPLTVVTHAREISQDLAL